MNEKKPRPSLDSTLKSADTEETIDLLFYRPLGYRWALLFNRFDISPNAVTIASIFLGVGAGVLFYFDNLCYNVAGMLLLVWANMYDSADGQLARMSGKKSEVGRVLDGLAGDAWFWTIYVAICLRLTGEWSYWIWILGAAAGFCHSKQAATADYYRNVHLFFLKGKAGSELSRSEREYEIYRSLPWKGNVVWKIYRRLYGNYTASQEKLSPQFQRFFALVQQRFGDKVPQALADEFRTASRPLMKYTNILSFNTRAGALFVSLFIGMPWLYFVFELTVLNVLLVYMIATHESFCRRFHLQLKQTDQA